MPDLRAELRVVLRGLFEPFRHIAEEARVAREEREAAWTRTTITLAARMAETEAEYLSLIAALYAEGRISEADMEWANGFVVDYFEGTA